VPAGRVALGLALAAAVALTVVLVGPGDTRLQGTNDLSATAPIAPVGRGKSVCQTRVLVPAGTAGIAVLPQGERDVPAGPILVTVRAAGRVLATGRSGPGRVGRWLDAPLRPTLRDERLADVCVRATGTSFTAAGIIAGSDAAAVRGGSPVSGAVSLRFLRAGEETWANVSPVLGARVEAAGAGPLGGVTLWAAAALTGALWAGALALAVRRA